MTTPVRYARNEDILSGQSGSDLFMMNAESGFYYALNETAGRVWHLLDQPRTEAEIVEALVAEYRVPPADCRHAIGSFLAELVRRDVVRPA